MDILFNIVLGAMMLLLLAAMGMCLVLMWALCWPMVKDIWHNR